MAKQAKAERLAQQATFIFQGTVKKLKAATMPNIPVTEKTLIVHVDETVRAPDALTQYEDTDITVQLGSREQLKTGERAIFYTNSWMIGESLAVVSVGHLAIETGPASAQRRGRAAAAAAASSEVDPGLQEQAAKADVVVTGKVTSVRVVEEPSGGAAQNPVAQFQGISEHSPVWQEALIEVNDVMKGEKLPRQLVVRFPSSTDVRWYDAPKFRPGQEAVFLLQKESAKSAAAGRARAAAQGKTGAAVYTALHTSAVQPLQKVEAIKTIISGAK